MAFWDTFHPMGMNTSIIFKTNRYSPITPIVPMQAKGARGPLGSHLSFQLHAYESRLTTRSPVTPIMHTKAMRSGLTAPAMAHLPHQRQAHKVLTYQSHHAHEGRLTRCSPITPITPMKAISRGLTKSAMEFSSPRCAPALAATKLLGAQPRSVAACERLVSRRIHGILVEVRSAAAPRRQGCMA
eukprot:scaffold89927_cov19-Tisochrysis_lutea.AAC.2